MCFYDDSRPREHASPGSAPLTPQLPLMPSNDGLVTPECAPFQQGVAKQLLGKVKVQRTAQHQEHGLGLGMGMGMMMNMGPLGQGSVSLDSLRRVVSSPEDAGMAHLVHEATAIFQEVTAQHNLACTNCTCTAHTERPEHLLDEDGLCAYPGVQGAEGPEGEKGGTSKPSSEPPIDIRTASAKGGLVVSGMLCWLLAWFNAFAGAGVNQRLLSLSVSMSLVSLLERKMTAKRALRSLTVSLVLFFVAQKAKFCTKSSLGVLLISLVCLVEAL